MAISQRMNKETGLNGDLRRKISRKDDDPTMGIGNGAMSGYLMNAEISDPNDHEELEADRVADKILSFGMIHRKRDDSVADDLKGGVESSLGRDIGNVHMHTDDAAAHLSESINARAFTDGNDIYFGEGEYRPDTLDGQRLIAHELAHVAQADTGVGRKIMRDKTNNSSTSGNTTVKPQSPVNSTTVVPVAPPPKEEESFSPEEFQTMEDPVFKKFVELVSNYVSSGKISGSSAAFLTANRADIQKKEGRGGLDAFLEEGGDLLGVGGATAGAVGGIMGASGNEKGSAQVGTGVAVANVASSGMGLTKDSMDAYKSRQERQQQSQELGLEYKSSGTDTAKVIGGATNTAGGILGLAGASSLMHTENSVKQWEGESDEDYKKRKTGEQGTGNNLAVVSSAMGLIGDSIGLGADSAEQHKHRQRNNAARTKIIKLVNTVKKRENSAVTTKSTELKKAVNDLPSEGSLSKMDDGGVMILNQKIDGILAKYSSGVTGIKPEDMLEIESEQDLQQAGLLNKTRQVSIANKKGKNWDVAMGAIGVALDITSLVGASMTAFGNGAGAILGAIASTIGAVAKIINYGKSKKDQYDKSNQTQADKDKAGDMVASVMGQVESLPKFEGDISTTDKIKKLGGDKKRDISRYYSTYVMLKSANVNMLGFLSGIHKLSKIDAGKADEVKEARKEIFKSVHAGVTE